MESYLTQYPDWIPAADLRRIFLRELARRQDWTSFLALYQTGLGDTLTCDALQARLASGTTLNFDTDLAALWAKPSLPDACDPYFGAAHDQGLLTSARLWTRIDRAADAGQPGTIASLTGWLPEDDRAARIDWCWRCAIRPLRWPMRSAGRTPRARGRPPRSR